jgi:hypothetical protein
MANPSSPRSPSLPGLPSRSTVNPFLDFWLARVAWQRLRCSTARTYGTVVVHLIAPVLGGTPVQRLAACDLEKARVVWPRAGVKASMRRKAVEALRSALRHAIARGLCEE